MDTPGPVVLAAGDIADEHRASAGTARVLESVPQSTILALGDNAYRCGTRDDYSEFYRPTWGQRGLLERTRACPGNHEFSVFGCVTKGDGYYHYFQTSHADVWRAATKDYYSFAIAQCRWHFVSLNTEIPCNGNAPQLRWLRADLEAHAAQPLLVFFHRPRFSSGEHGSYKDLQELWSLLCAFRVEIVLSGHDHNYERFHPQNAQAERDPAGTTQFVVGTGGRDIDSRGTKERNSAAWLEHHGVLRLTLNDQSYDWEFLTTAGAVLDSRSAWPINRGH